MASYKVKFLHVILAIGIFNFIARGAYGACTSQQLTLTQSKTGDAVNGKPQFLVEVFNGCGDCGQVVTLDCTGFQSVEPVNGGVLQKNGNSCLLLGGTPINPVQEASFNYAWDTQFPFKIISSTLHC